MHAEIGGTRFRDVKALSIALSWKMCHRRMRSLSKGDDPTIIAMSIISTEQKRSLRLFDEPCVFVGSRETRNIVFFLNVGGLEQLQRHR